VHGCRLTQAASGADGRANVGVFVRHLVIYYTYYILYILYIFLNSWVYFFVKFIPLKFLVSTQQEVNL